MNKYMTIGQRIKKLLEESNYSRTEVAEKIDVSKQTLYKYENDIVTNIPSDKIEKMAKIFNCSPAYLMGWNQNEIDAVAEMQKEANEYSDRLENKFKSFMEEFGELELTKEEMQEVFDYAKYIKSKRK